MIWDSVFWMTVIDLIVMMAALQAVIIFFRFHKLFARFNLIVSAALIVFALVITAIFHLADLLVMHSIVVSQDDSMSTMADLHLNWHWYETLISMGAITIGLTVVASRVLPQIVSSMDGLQAKNQDLDALVNQRVAELIALNQKLENEIKEHAQAEDRSRYLAKLLSHVSDAVISADKDFNVVSWNEGAEKIYGWSAEEVMGRNILTLFQTIYPHGEQPEEARKHYLEHGEWKGEAIHTRKHGQRIDVFISSSPILDETGEFVGAVGIIRDITDYKEARAALSRERNLLRAVLDHLLDFVYVKDQDSRFILANKAIAAFMDADSPDGLIGKSDRDFYPEDEAAVFLADERHIIESGEAIINKYEMDTRPQHGTPHVILTTKLPYRDDKGDIIGVIGISRDVTDLNEAERLRAEKEKLQVALDKERELSRLKVEFMANVAHEFRTPLTIIMTSSAMLNSYWDRMDEEARIKKLSGIQRQVNHLENILDDVGMTVEAERGQIQRSPQWVDVPKLCKRLDAEVQVMLSEEHKLKITCPEDMNALYLDGELLYSMLFNLVSNAIKYSPDGGPITLTLSSTKDYFQIAIQDHGIGIPNDDQNRLLDPFFRGSNIGTIRGTGSGLSIVKKIVDLHSGDIYIQSQLDRGTTFTITLPISQNGGQD